MATILVIAAHPDDEILGCGATMAKHVQAGDTVHVVIMATGVTSRPAAGINPSEAITQLHANAKQANQRLGVTSTTILPLPDNQMDTVSRLSITQQVENLIQQHQPETVYTHWSSDVNVDHRRVHEAVITACRPQPGHPVRAILFFEVPSSTEWQTPAVGHAFQPNWFVDVSNTLALKLDALTCYASEMRQWPHARSYQAVEHLARWRGATVGCQAAEAFVLGRVIHV
jgi:N-acetylglucosamine malate deacetylase 1